MILDKTDRDRFAIYLETEADSSDGIAEQMLKLPATRVFAEREKEYAKACRVVAEKLRRTEDF